VTKPQATDGQGTDGQGSDGQGTDGQGTEPHAVTDPPLRLVRGTPSPEELSALITVVAVLSSSGDEGPDQGDHPGGQRRRAGRSLWNAPSRLVGLTNQRGHRGWRTSAYPR
jgi:Acyl-CoA carboxylase epsilon subunit